MKNYYLPDLLAWRTFIVKYARFQIHTGLNMWYCFPIKIFCRHLKNLEYNEFPHELLWKTRIGLNQDCLWYCNLVKPSLNASHIRTVCWRGFAASLVGQTGKYSLWVILPRLNSKFKPMRSQFYSRKGPCKPSKRVALSNKIIILFMCVSLLRTTLGT